MIRLPNHARTVLWQANQLRKDYIESFGSEPKLEEIASALGIGATTLRSLYQSASATISLDKQIGKSGEDSRKLYEVIPDESETVLEGLMKSDMQQVVRQALASLSAREEKVIRLRFGISADNNDHINFPITKKELNKLEERSHANA